MKEEVLKQICKMITSGEIPNEVYDKYLSKCPIGFMEDGELFNYIIQLETNWKELKKWLEEEHREDAIVINLTWKHATGKVLDKMQELENKNE